MGRTVVAFETGLGAMSYAFENAGFQVIAAYEEDRKAAALYEQNFTSKITHCSFQDLTPQEIPNMDILIGHIANGSYMVKYMEILHHKQPKIFFFSAGPVLIRNTNFKKFINDLTQNNYKIYYRNYDIQEITGIPVKESCLCIIGISDYISKEYTFMGDVAEYVLPLEDFCTKEPIKDTWYNQIDQEKIKTRRTENSFLCWDKDGYIEKKFVQWNTVKIPLVRIDGTVRKLTHEEVARLKGYPYEFWLQKDNLYWLYKRLMYSPNVSLLCKIAKSIMYIIDESSFRDSRVVNAINFEKLFGEYLICKTGRDCLNTSNEAISDFVCVYEGINVYIELKFYNYNFGIEAKILRFCKNLKRKPSPDEGIYVVVVGNIVKDELKQICKDDFGIVVWDVKNILWLFAEYTDIRNDFVSILNYSVNGLLPVQPTLSIGQIRDAKGEFSEKLYKKYIDDTVKAKPQNDFGKELKRRLGQIKPGLAEAVQYEELCTEILKYILADYLTLWKVQEKSNANLYRFDLCCKIKNGTNQDFFDMVMNYFNTKYIIFEFKNYSKKITQKEIYTTEKYLYEKALRSVAILISRKGPDEHALWAIKGCLRENGKLILCLSDEDLSNLIDIMDKKEKSTAEYFEDLLDELLIHLEK